MQNIQEKDQIKQLEVEIERLREQERKMTNHALERMEEIERLQEKHDDIRILNEQYFNENDILIAEIERLREALRNIAMRGPDGELWNTKAEIWMIAEAALQQKESE